MINLLSNPKKSEIRAARANTILIRYITVLILALGFIIGVLVVSQKTLESLNESAQQKLQSTSSSNQNEIDPALIQDISTHLTSDSQVSNALSGLSAAVPKDTILRKIPLTSDNLKGSPLTLTLYAKPTVQPSDIEQSLSSTSTFSGVTVSEAKDSNEVPGYTVKYDVTITILTTGGSPL